MRWLLDTNILLDIALTREPYAGQARAFWDAVTGENPGESGYVSAAAVTDFYYVARRQVGHGQAIRAVQLLLNSLNIIPVSAAVLAMALSFPGTDFEDNVQIACAEHELLDAIITRDKGGFKHSPVYALTPAEALAQISTGAS